MNRRNFLKRGAVGAVAAAAVVVPSLPAGKEVIKNSDFPETQKDMEALVETAKKNGKFHSRMEGAYILEGLSKTDTGVSVHWYYHKGDRVAVLHVREFDNHICFYINSVDERAKVSYLPPYPRFT